MLQGPSSALVGLNMTMPVHMLMLEFFAIPSATAPRTIICGTLRLLGTGPRGWGPAPAVHLGRNIQEEHSSPICVIVQKNVVSSMCSPRECCSQEKRSRFENSLSRKCSHPFFKYINKNLDF